MITDKMISRFDDILEMVKSDEVMRGMWEKYRDDNFVVGDISWHDVNRSLRELKERTFG